MSMNLNAECDGKVIWLRQTPSQISWMCIVQPDGSIPGELTGRKAKHALHIYLQWVKYSTNGTWKDREAEEAATHCSIEEYQRVKKLMDKCKRLRVWVM